MMFNDIRSLDDAAWDQVKAYFAFMADKHYLDVRPGMTLSDRFEAIKHNYKLFQSLVDEGLDSWMRGDPYEVGNWAALFTPIEAAAWHDIRAAGLPLWPQLPVGRFFVDFGNPVAKIALECDGKEWHDERKDAKRDQILNEMGWKVFRAPGWQCKRVMPVPDDFYEWSNAARAEFRFQKHWGTLDRVIEQIKQAFEERT